MRVYEMTSKTVFLLIVLGSIVTIVRGIDDVFPFSSYSMYSRVFEPDPFFVQHSVIVELPNGDIRQLATDLDIGPFWGASFREALLVENDPNRIKSKFESAFEWLNERRIKRGKAPLRSLRLYRHELPWSEFVRRRLENQELRSLYVENSILRLEVRGAE